MKQYLEARERINKIFDGLWLYRECKKIDGIPNIPGTYFRIVLKVLQKTGAKPTDGLETDASQYKIGGYAQVNPLTFDELKKMIAVYGVVLAGFRGSNAGWQSAYIRPPRAGEATWGHAVFLIGYNENYLIGENSWGENWGDKGKFYISKDYLPFEAWVILNDLPTEFLNQNAQTGWVAKEYINNPIETNDIIETATRLKIRETPNGKLINVLAKGQKLVILNEEIKKVGGYNWINVKII